MYFLVPGPLITYQPNTYTLGRKATFNTEVLATIFGGVKTVNSALNFFSTYWVSSESLWEELFI